MNESEKTKNKNIFFNRSNFFLLFWFSLEKYAIEYLIKKNKIYIFSSKPGNLWWKAMDNIVRDKSTDDKDTPGPLTKAIDLIFQQQQLNNNSATIDLDNYDDVRNLNICKKKVTKLNQLCTFRTFLQQPTFHVYQGCREMVPRQIQTL